MTIHDITNVNRTLAFGALRECADRQCTHYADGAPSHFDAPDNARSV